LKNISRERSRSAQNSTIDIASGGPMYTFERFWRFFLSAFDLLLGRLGAVPGWGSPSLAPSRLSAGPSPDRLRRGQRR
jgi:hypothetical protein